MSPQPNDRGYRGLGKGPLVTEVVPELTINSLPALATSPVKVVVPPV
jgi:hypothetical protein